MTWWLWNSRKPLASTIARPTVILPTAGGPNTSRSVMPQGRGDEDVDATGFSGSSRLCSLLLGDLPAYVVHVEAADRADQLLEGRGGKGAGLAEDQDPVAEGHQRRDRRDLQATGEHLLGLGVDAGEGHVVVGLRAIGR